MARIRLGVVSTSRKESEQRLPLHPAHVASIPADLRDRVILEHGYGEPFGFADDRLSGHVGGFMKRSEIFAECDAVLLFKPILQDFQELREEQILWGCPHFVQNTDVTQTSIDRRLTVISMEAMAHWPEGKPALPIGPRVSEMAGYCTVQHGLTLVGRTGNYGRRLKAAVIGYGASAQGAIRALHAQGIRDLALVTRRLPATVVAPPSGARVVQLVQEPDGALYASAGDARTKLAEFLSGYDIIVNCVLQDTNHPQTFLTEEDLPLLAPGTLILDVSNDTGMGFSWARTTTFTEPFITLRNNVRYYAVNGSPSYLWDSASWILSEAIMPHLRSVLDGEEGWAADPTVGNAIEVRRGVVQNPNILSYQHRAAEYPHAVVE